MKTYCAHCGADFSAPSDDPLREKFCCRGCATAFSLLAECGLGGHAEVRLQAVAHGAAPHPVPIVSGEWEGWETPAFLERHALRLAALYPANERPVERWAISWSVEGLHCPACVWVLERLPFLDLGVQSSTIDLGRGVLRIVLDATRTDARQIAQVAATLGYRLRPWISTSDQQRQRNARALLMRAAVAFACAVGAMQLAMNLTAGELTGDLEPSAYLLFGIGAIVLALPAATWAVGSWWLSLWRAIRYGRWSLDATAAVVVAVGLSASVLNLVRGSHATYADAVAMFCALLLAGRVVLSRVQDQLAVQGSRLSGLLPDLHPEVGALLELRAGQRFPADGTLVSCSAATMDASLLTGESRPIALIPGQAVEAGTMLLSGVIRLRVERTGADTRVARILARAEAEAAVRQPTENSSWERWYGLALVALALGAAPWGIDRMVAVVMAACPCAIGMAIPLARARVLIEARLRGVLVPAAETLVRLRTIRHVLLDKTGTLTTGRPAVVSWTWMIDVARQSHIAGAVSAAEQQCRHPVALAISSYLAPVPDIAVDHVIERSMIGVTARCGNDKFSIGPDGLGGIQVVWAGNVVARCTVVDGQRPEAISFIQECQSRQLSIAIASGDATAPVHAMASALGVSQSLVYSQMSPEGKVALVNEATVMIGDGVNDALALSKAGVGIAIRGGLATGLSTADIVITDLPRPLAAVGDVFRASDRLAQRESVLLWMTIGYNAIAVGCALAGIWGPLICAIGMPISSLIAVLIASHWRPFGET